MSRKENLEATIAMLAEMRKQFGTINSLDAVKAFFNAYPDICLFFVNRRQKVSLWTPEVLRILGVSGFEDQPIMFIVREAMKRYIPDKIKRRRVYAVQGSFGFIAYMGAKELPPFSIIGKSNSDHVRSLVETDFFQDCGYGEHVFTSDGKFLGTIVIHQLCPVVGYSEKNYRKDSDFMSPTEFGMLKIGGRKIYDWIMRRIA